MFSKSTVFRLYLIGLAVASFAAVLLIFHPVEAKEKPALSGFVYTESNIPIENGNTILAFRRDDNGNLTPLSNSPFPTRGTGIVDTAYIPGSLDADQQIITNPEKTLLFAVNSGSSSIAVFNISPDGSLSPVEGSPFPSGGVYPSSLGLAGKFLYVANRNLDPQDLSKDASGSLPNYTVFRVTRKGRLISVPNSTFEVPNGSGPTQALISQDKKFLFGAEQYGKVLRAFRLLDDGRLAQSPNSPLSGFSAIAGPTPFGPVGLEVHPKLPLLYAGYPTLGKLVVHSYDQTTGEIKLLKAVPNSGVAICWLYANKAGTRLYAADAFSNNISVYDLTDPTTPVEIQKITLQGDNLGFTIIPPVGLLSQEGPFNIALDPTESFLYVIRQRLLSTAPIDEGNGVHVLKINPQDGTLTEVSSSPYVIHPVNGSRPQGIVVF